LTLHRESVATMLNLLSVSQGLPPAAVFKRWVAFGLFSSHVSPGRSSRYRISLIPFGNWQSRLHGSKSFRVPWLYDDDGKDEASKVLAKMVKAKLRLMPYLFAQVSRQGRSESD
jgi:alpha-D-xyloside xylohydrolase